MRAGRPEDLEGVLALARQAAAAGDIDVAPAGGWLERLLVGFDWQTRSRVVERSGRLVAALLVLERQVPGGTITRLEMGGEPELAAELLRWGLRYSRACGALAAQVWRARGRSGDLSSLGLSPARAFLRMDRRDLHGLPAARLPDGYRLADETAVIPETAWAETYNRAFADHWRFSPMDPGMVTARRSRPDRGPELMALTADGEPAALVTCSIESHEDGRAQPVGLVGTVGTVPTHRRRGLAWALLAEALARLLPAGARSASLYVDGLNPTRAFDLYARAGFAVGFEFEVWEADFT